MGIRPNNFIILVKVLVLIWASSLYACNCRNKGDNTQAGKADPDRVEANGGLRMEMSDKYLRGANKKVELTLLCADGKQPVILKDFRLHVAIIKEEGKDSQIAYNGYINGHPTPIRQAAIEERVIHFTKIEQLAPNDDPLKIAFTLEPDLQASKVVTIFKLLDAKGQVIKEKKIIWEAEKSPIDIVLTRMSPEYLQGNDGKVQIEIKNQGKQKIEAGQAKLKITRKLGTNVPIIGVVGTATPGEYELKLGELKPGETILQDLTIDTETDVNLELTFQVTYLDSYLSNEVTVHWDQGVQLVLEDIKYNTDTHLITYTIKNTGADIAKNLQIEYVSRTAGIKLNGVELVSDKPQTQNLDELAAGVTKEKQSLGKLDFNGHKRAEFVFRLVYEGGSTAAQLYAFHAEDIQLSINKLVYDPDTGLVTYSLKNTGTVKAENVKFRYSNVSDEKNVDGKTALLENVPVSTINIGDIPGNNGKTGDRELKLDLRYADEATFKFELIYNEKPITQEERKVTFKAKPVKFKLVPITSCLLVGSKQEIKCKIEVEADGRELSNIDCSKLSLIISNLLENEAHIWKSAEVTYVAKLTGNELGVIGNDITLHIHPEKEKEASFRFALNYRGKPVEHAPAIDIIWKEASLLIVGMDHFEDEDTHHFKLENTNHEEAIDTKSMTVELVSNNEAKFVLVDKSNNEIGASATLHQLIGTNLLSANTLTNPIPFKLADANGNNKATIAIVVKRGDIELAKHNVVWNKQDVCLTLKLGNVCFYDKAVNKITLTNTGRAINTNKLKIELHNNKGVKFKLRSIIGDKITASLQEITLKEVLTNNEVVEIPLQLEGANNQYDTELYLKVLDNTNKILYELPILTWINSSQINVDLKFEEMEQIDELFCTAREDAEKEKLKINKEQKTDQDEDAELKWYKQIEQIIGHKTNMQQVVQSAENRYKELCGKQLISSKLCMEELDAVIGGLTHRWLQPINNYIIKESLEYASSKVLDFAKNATVINIGKPEIGGAENKKPMKFWFVMLKQLVDKINTDEARKVLEAAQKVSERVDELVKTPKKTKKVNDEVSRRLKNSNSRRNLFGEEAPKEPKRININMSSFYKAFSYNTLNKLGPKPGTK